MQHITNASYPSQVIHGAYYPHIDGIRAFAVLPVVLFHVLARLCPGGYAGVDVFFVISGYLITGGILRDLARDRFTIRDFYHRRIRRILPAYFAVVATVFIFGCMVYHALPLMRLADGTIMGSLFVANQYLWNIGGDYFTPDIHTNPLLHLWSLSVEEQFYLFIPVIFLVAWKFYRRGIVPLLALLAILSFGWSVYAMASGKQVMAFYVLPLRAWELLAGSLLAFTAFRGAVRCGNEPGKAVKKWNTIGAGLGLLLVLLPYVLYSQQTPFPGGAVLPSVVGTALLIQYGAAGWVGGLLAWRPLVVVGKMSYSLYLWHWPVTVYWKYMVYDQLYMQDYFGMLLVSFLLAFLSWRFVEIPVRTSQVWTPRRSFAFAAAGILLLVGIGVVCVFNRGWPTLLHPTANEMLDRDDIKPQFVESLIRKKIRRIAGAFGYVIPDDKKNTARFSVGVPTSPEFLLVGDSHALVLQPGLEITLSGLGKGGRCVTYNGKEVFLLGKAECTGVLAELAQYPQISKVVLVQYWCRYMKTTDGYEALDAFSARLKTMGKSLLIVADIPNYAGSPVDNVDRLAKGKIIGCRRLPPDGYMRQSVTEYETQQGEINRHLETICRKNGAVFVPLYQALKRGDDYGAILEQDGKIVSLYRDNDHLSRNGSLRAARFLVPYLFPESFPEKSHTQQVD